MKFQTSLNKAAIATFFIAGSIIALPTFAHQRMDSSKGHHSQHTDATSNMMMTENMVGMNESGMMGHMENMDMSGMMDHMAGMDMSEMIGCMGGMDMSRMMEQIGSMGMSMMMEKNNGMHMMQRMGVTDFTDDQQKSINGIHDAMRKSHWELMGSAMDEQANLRDAMAVERPDPKIVGEIYGRLFDLKRRMIESRLETHNAVLDILSEEQREQMQSNMMMSGGHGQRKNHDPAKQGS